ncbi:tRNA uridine-5-carboxymethylaminomethyl(34) synthesis enzyme MnmG [Tenuifilum thalassicum]|uniref:tRNA uridine 5-carboxymethylaminomethyl modification enzyme MnmG n=1 Tax=Tenuifilum thalassicum TaxID=2590900 RepID=A0A7D4BG93_9BACT|nr:tRNA uridine-5-carboxymethylaminomethyl(34) synthesis enzyme MnmG [Tenuifilum thalassicum]QKG81178.1 tRNA uridine-5-carboxymethylaminomethyl(34) synthesis enzyme MnmG [Tenuifilum thalassicum]
MELDFDVIVVGGGHAGCEAAAIAAKMGSRVLLISMDLTKLAQMSCNPAIGGIAKGQIVREIDALGGYTAKVTDLTTIHFRMLNQSKGPAMWSPRAQTDRHLFSMEWRKYIESIPNLYLWQDEVTELIVKNGTVLGVKTKTNQQVKARTVILTNGTFLNGKIHIGNVNFQGGRIGELGSYGLSDQLLSLGFTTGRMKTGTPVRIDGRTVNYESFTIQPSDNISKFSYNPNYYSSLPKKNCYIVHTNPEVHQILREGFNFSPLFTGKIKGVGPRYCPSIEDKINTFSNKTSHQLFLEPEGIYTYEMYLNGFSSSLPIEVQYNALTKIPGFEKVHILRPGYAIEYDYFDPTQLNHTLETKIVKNLFFAGQINGTTGYEEAAGQGLVAGVNAHFTSHNIDQKFILKRNEAYIGVLIDDLVTKGVDEPYRMFTSRAEYRILIRQDNADERLTPIAHKYNMVNDEDLKRLENKVNQREKLISLMKSKSLAPSTINPLLVQKKSKEIIQKRKVIDILLRPEIKLLDLLPYLVLEEDYTSEVIESAEIKLKYDGYIQKEKLIALKIERLEHVKIPENFDYNLLNSLSTEARIKLTKIKPQTIAQAKRIPGISPSDINVLLVYFGR